MEYLCLIYFDETKLATVSAEELVIITDECMTYSDQSGKTGHYIASHTLQSMQTATTLRHQDGRLAMTDGSFTEIKEQLDGFYLIEVRDLNRALQIVTRIPLGRLDCVEVQSVKEWE